LKKRPSDWEGTKDAYPPGKNPWLDLYPEKKAAEIGRVIGLTRADDFCDLRLLLAHAADEARKTFRLIGGPASDGKRRQWAARAVADAKRFRITLLKAGDRSSTDVQWAKHDSRKVVRIVPSSVVETSVAGLVAAIDEFIKLAEPAAKQPVVRILSGAREPTSHSIYLQSTVDLVTEVFIHFRGLEPVKRVTDNEGVRGEYPEFCRLAADPILSSYYTGYERRCSQLDGQIQDAVARYNRRKR
jgi:hypothetical protein